MKTKIRLVTQKNRGYCGPASVKMVLDSYGIRKSQKEIGVFFSATEKEGCDLIASTGLFNFWNLDAEYFKNASLTQVAKYLQQEIYPILYWDRNMGGHYSVFAAIEKDRVYIADPGNSKRIINLRKERFLERWRDPENSEDKREIIVIKKRG